MSIFTRFQSLSTWNKLGVVGAVASIVAIPLSIVLWKTPPAVMPTQPQPIVSIDNTSIHAQNNSVAAGRDVNISKLVSAINRNEQFLYAIRAAQRKWSYLDPLLTEYQMALNNIGKISLSNCVAKSAIVTAATDSIESDLSSFSESTETAHSHAEDVPEIDTLLKNLHLIRNRISSIKSLYRSLEGLSNKVEIAFAGSGSPGGDYNRSEAVQEAIHARDEILK